MAQYRAGTVSVTAGSPVVVGLNTSWTGALAAGQLFSITKSGVFYTIKSVDTDTQITLASNFTGTTGAAQFYLVQRDFTTNNNYPTPAYGDVDTAPLIAQTLLQIDSDLASLSPVAALFEGDVELQGAITFSGDEIYGSFTDTAAFKLAMNQWQAGSVQAMYESGLISMNEGDTSRIVWYSGRVAIGGIFEGLLSQWLKSSQGWNDQQAADQISALRSQALGFAV